MKQKLYKSYLIRCWQVAQSADEETMSGWRFSLESVDGTDEKAGFTDPQDLLTFLTKQINGCETELADSSESPAQQPTMMVHF